jgi:sugar lactone lactonase YvrE
MATRRSYAGPLPDGRVFLVLARIDGSDGPQVVEAVDDGFVPYPDADWNTASSDTAAALRFVRINAQRVGPDGFLWLVDVGAPGFGNAPLPGGPKLVQVDVTINRVTRTYPLEAFTEAQSFIDDVRFHGSRAYLTDAGAGAIIVLDLETGSGRRVLAGHESTTAQRPMTAEGNTLLADGEPVYIHADQLEVSPDGSMLHFQPCTGPLYRVPTGLLDDPTSTEEEIAAAVELFAETGSTGGTAIAADGTIYLSDTDASTIAAIAADGSVSVIAESPALSWVDAMWLDANGDLWLPAAQLHRMSPFNDGRSTVREPAEVFTIPVGTTPPPTDHR